MRLSLCRLHRVHTHRLRLGLRLLSTGHECTQKGRTNGHHLFRAYRLSLSFSGAVLPMSSFTSFTFSVNSATPPRGFIDSVNMGIITSMNFEEGSAVCRLLPPMAAAMIVAMDLRLRTSSSSSGSCSAGPAALGPAAVAS